MSERTSDRTGHGQDLLGIALCMIGGFSVVSILLAIQGQESHNLLTRPVEGLIVLAGPAMGLAFSAAVAALGAAMFLRSEVLAAGRHLAGLAGVAFGLAMVLGGIASGAGGLIGGALPGALSGPSGTVGLGGLLSGLVVGLVVAAGSAWLAWPRLAARAAVKRPAAKPRRVSELAFPHLDESDGVSSAEALALQPAPPSAATGTAAALSTSPSPRTDVRVGGGVPAGTRPLAISDEQRARSIPSPPEAAGDVSPPRPDSSVSEQPADPDLVAGGRARPSLEGVERVGDGEPATEAGVLKAAAVDTRPVAPVWEDEATDEVAAVAPSLDEEAGDAEPAGEPAVKASWEQVGLFDEPTEADAKVEEADEADEADDEEPEDEDVGEVAEADDGEEEEVDDEEVDDEEEELDEAAELDEEEEDEEDDEEEEDEEELDEAAELDEEEEDEEDDDAEEEDEDDEEAEEVAELDEEQEEAEDDDAEEEDEPGYVLTPSRAGETPSEESLVFEAGCLILEEDRVAVSMLQRRFSLDFDRACAVLDQLQEAGLIGPYVGGRTREILLDMEQWQAMAAESAAS